jgi:hypothetical protein
VGGGSSASLNLIGSIASTSAEFCSAEFGSHAEGSLIEFHGKKHVSPAKVIQLLQSRLWAPMQGPGNRLDDTCVVLRRLGGCASLKLIANGSYRPELEDVARCQFQASLIGLRNYPKNEQRIAT